MATTQQEKEFFAIVAEKRPTAVNRLTSDSDLWSFFMSLADKGSWSRSSGWTWSNTSTTERMCESLVKRGLAIKNGSGYVLSEAALALWRPYHQEIERQRSIERKQSMYKNELQWQDRHARDFATRKLIEAHPEQFEAWIVQYKADNPVEAP